LSAGQQSVIEIVLTGETWAVNRSLDIYVFSNDKKHPVQHVVVEYSTLSERYFEPSLLDFGVVPSDRLPVDRSVKIIESKSGLAETEINNAEVFPSAEFMGSRVKQENDLHRRISVTLKNNAPLGDFYEHLTIVDTANGLHYRLNVVGSVRGEVHATPRVLDYGEINRNANDKNDTIVLHSRNNDPQISILSIDTSESIKSFVFSELDSEDKSKFTVRLSTRNYDGAWTTTEISGSLVISCIDSQEQIFSINIPVRFRMRVGRVLNE